jgi:HD-GYP domain-containing protein (c-di-GMP phosphodiesterase class II)
MTMHKESVDCVLYHHERYDGKGYPHRLKGEAIPLGARIMAVADSFEAMTSDRPYRKALSQEVAIEGRHFGHAARSLAVRPPGL